MNAMIFFVRVSNTISICFYGESILLKAESFAKVAFISKRFMSFILFFLDFIGNAEIYI